MRTTNGNSTQADEKKIPFVALISVRPKKLSTVNGNSSLEDKKNIPFVILARRENERCARAQRTGILLNRTRRRPCSLCSRVERMRGAHENNKR